MAGDGTGVPARHRPGQRGVAEAQRVVQRGVQQRVEDPVGVPDARVAQPVHRLVDERDEVVGAVCEGGVVQRAVLLGDPLHGAAELAHQPLGQRAQVVRGGHPERDALAQPFCVGVGAGERHGRVQRQRTCAAHDDGREHTEPVRTGRVRHHLAGPDRQVRHDRGQRVVGYRENDQICVRGAGTAGGDREAGVGERRHQDRADPTGADHGHRTDALV